MSKNTNVCMLIGNLTRDCELASTGGTEPATIAKFGIAVNDLKDHANFFDCELFGARADALSKFLKKGVKVSIVGSLRYSTWETTQGKRSKITVRVGDIEFLTWPEKKQDEQLYLEDCPF